MKKTLLGIIIVVWTCNLFSQNSKSDIIVTLQEQKIEAKIVEISKTEIKYYEIGLENGPIFILSTADISSIIFANGKVKIFNNPASILTQKNPISEESQQQNVDTLGQCTPKVLFRNYIDVSAIFGQEQLDVDSSMDLQKVSVAGPAINVEIGCFIKQMFFTGIGLGVHGLMANTQVTCFDKTIPIKARIWVMPIYGDFKCYILRKAVAPFVNASVGGFVGLGGSGYIEYFGKGTVHVKPDGGFYCRLGLGMEYRHIIVGIGYQCLKANSIKGDHLGYVKVGVRIGK